MIDVSALLMPLSSEDPSGPNLEYDKAYLELERLARFKPEQQIGKTIVPAEEPDWRAVEKAAVELFSSTKDLRIANHLAKALLNTGGLPGFAQGLAVLRGLVEAFWPSVHPQLDPDDDNDPTTRVNILAELCDATTYLNWLRGTPIATAKGLGSVCFRDLQFSSGELPTPPDVKPVSAATIEAIFAGMDLSALESYATAARESRGDVAAIDSLVTDYVGIGHAQGLSKVRTLLDQMSKVLEKHLAIRTAAVGAATLDGAQKDDVRGGGVANSPQRLCGEILSRDDVTNALNKILDYYSRFEPSSPVPLLLKRTKRLVSMSFLDIVRDLAPDGVQQVELIQGKSEEDGST